MTQYPYTTVTGKVGEFLAKIRVTGVPEKVTHKWLASIGFKSSNDPTMIGVFKFIDFVDEEGNATELWMDYRGKNHREVLAQGIQRGYSELYDIYPDAHERSTEELENFFSTKSTAGKQVISKTQRTFKALCDQADFPLVPQAAVRSDSTQSMDVPQVVETPPAVQSPVIQSSPTLHIDIQIHISPDASPEQIDQIFSSMVKHLYKA